MDEEVFRNLPGFSLYSISNYGRVYSERSRGFIAGSNRGSQRGIVLQLWTDQGECVWAYLHRLVAELHHPDFFPNLQVEALDDDLTNCHIDNLLVGDKGVKGKNKR